MRRRWFGLVFRAFSLVTVPTAEKTVALPFELGGMLALEARALAQDPASVLADELTGSLEAETGRAMADLLCAGRTDLR